MIEKQTDINLDEVLNTMNFFQNETKYLFWLIWLGWIEMRKQSSKEINDMF